MWGGGGGGGGGGGEMTNKEKWASLLPNLYPPHLMRRTIPLLLALLRIKFKPSP